MAKLQLLIIFSAFVAISCGGDDQVIPPQPVPNNETTTVAPSTTPASTTSTAKPTTTIKPTNPPPTTPTQKPTTPPPPTPAPKPTPPTPTPQPPKPVDPPTGVWQVNYTNTNVSCLLVQFALQIEIPYNTTFNKTYTAPVDIPANATATGTCGGKDQSITLKWNPVENASNIVDDVTLTFSENSTSKLYHLKEIKLNITPDNKNFPGYNGTDTLTLNHVHEEFGTSVSKSYRCIKKQKLDLTDANSKVAGSIYVSHLQFQAFHNSTNKQFTTAEECSPFDTPDIVPIAVGCSLVALIIIVLIAYLIGRRRRQARGYLSMFTQTKKESDYIPMKNVSCFQ